jgi:hypothetical protein
VQHLCLEPDFTDPPEIKVRNTASFDGCMYLQTGKMGKHLAYVLGPVIENLWELGYQKKGPDQNIWAMPVCYYPKDIICNIKRYYRQY